MGKVLAEITLSSDSEDEAPSKPEPKKPKIDEPEPTTSIVKVKMEKTTETEPSTSFNPPRRDSKNNDLGATPVLPKEIPAKNTPSPSKFNIRIGARKDEQMSTLVPQNRPFSRVTADPALNIAKHPLVLEDRRGSTVYCNGPPPVSASTAASEDTAPLLEQQVHFDIPDFGLASLIESATHSQPPTLQPEVDMSKINPQKRQTSSDTCPNEPPRQFAAGYKIPKKNVEIDINAVAVSISKSVSTTRNSNPEASTAYVPSTALSDNNYGFKRNMERVAHKVDKGASEESAKIIKRVQDRLNPKLGDLASDSTGRKKKKVQMPPAETSHSREHNDNLTGCAGVEVHCTSNSRAAHRKGRKSMEQVRILEEKFKENANPQQSDILDMTISTGLDRTEIRLWFKKRRMSEPAGTSPVSGYPEDSLPYPNHTSSTNIMSSVAESSLQQSHQAHKIKYLKDPKQRTISSVEIQNTLKSIENCSKEYFMEILKVWKQKARRIFKIANKLAYPRNPDILISLQRESRRLHNLVRCDPFSKEQKGWLSEWKREFLEEISEHSEYMKTQQDLTINDIYDRLIRPWIIPAFYSKIAKEGERLLTLQVALHDLAKLFDENTKFDWNFPFYIQHDYDPNC